MTWRVAASRSAPVKVVPAATSLAALVALLVASAPVAGAQRVTASLDAGGIRVGYADTSYSSAALVSPAVRADWARARVSASGTFSRFAGNVWSSNGVVATSLYTPAAGPLLGEIAGSAGGSAHQDGTRTAQLFSLARAHLVGSTLGLFAGAGAGRTLDGFAWRNVRLAEAGASARAGGAIMIATVSPVAVGDTVRYVDSRLTVSWVARRVEIRGEAGNRAGQQLPALPGSVRSWGNASAAAWLAPRFALVASAGTYPVDYTQGFPGGRYMSLGIRVRSGSGRSYVSGERPSAGEARTPSSTAAARAGVLDFRVVTIGGVRTLQVRAPRARTVEVQGDPTGWRPVSLVRTRDDGWWSTTLPAATARGTYQLNVRVNGGAWVVPPGLVQLKDEFGGVVGLLVIP